MAREAGNRCWGVRTQSTWRRTGLDGGGLRTSSSLMPDINVSFKLDRASTAAGIVLFKSLYEELKDTVFTHYTHISPAPRMTLMHQLLENGNTGSLTKTATVCRAKCISVIVLSVKEMAQSTRHLKWTRKRLWWTFVLLRWTQESILVRSIFKPPKSHHHPLVIHEFRVYLHHTHITRSFRGEWSASISLCSNCRTHLSKPE